MRKRWPGILCLIHGVVSVGLMVIPPVAMGEPVRARWWEDGEPKATAVEAKTEVSVGKFSFSWRKKQEPAAPAQPAQPPAEQPVDWLQISTIGGLTTALLGLLVSPFAFTSQRRNRPLAVTGAVLCSAALAWQYIMIGIAVGVAVTILLIVLSHL